MLAARRQAAFVASGHLKARQFTLVALTLCCALCKLWAGPCLWVCHLIVSCHNQLRPPDPHKAKPLRGLSPEARQQRQPASGIYLTLHARPSAFGGGHADCKPCDAMQGAMQGRIRGQRLQQRRQQPRQGTPSGGRCLTLHVCKLEAGSGHAIIEDVERPGDSLQAQHVIAVGRDVNLVHHLIAATSSLQARMFASLVWERACSIAVACRGMEFAGHQVGAAGSAGGGECLQCCGILQGMSVAVEQVSATGVR